MQFDQEGFSDLSIEDMEARILVKELSLRSLVNKAVLLARVLIAVLARIQVVMAASKEKHPPIFYRAMYAFMSRTATIAQDLEDIVFKTNKAPGETEAETPTLEDVSNGTSKER